MAVLNAGDVGRILLRMAESGAPIHRARAALEIGDPLERRPMTRRDGLLGWELADRHGGRGRSDGGEVPAAGWGDRGGAGGGGVGQDGEGG